MHGPTPGRAWRPPSVSSSSLRLPCESQYFRDDGWRKPQDLTEIPKRDLQFSQVKVLKQVGFQQHTSGTQVFHSQGMGYRCSFVPPTPPLAGLDALGNLAARLDLGSAEFVGLLQIQPDLRRRPEIAR